MRLCRDGKMHPYAMHRTESELKHDFWKRVKVGKEDDCWPWTGANDCQRGYGVVWNNGRKWKTHRYAYFVTNGGIPFGLLVCHRCDNPPCCNPNHLFLGTCRDNNNDMLQKGRANRERGEARYNARLKEEDVRQIRARYQKRKVGGMGIDRLAEIYGVGRTMIQAIVTRKRWAHVN